MRSVLRFGAPAVVNVAADEPTHSRARHDVRGEMLSGGEPRSSHQRRQSVRRDGYDLDFRIFRSHYGGERPRHDFVPGRKARTTDEEPSMPIVLIRAFPLRNGFDRRHQYHRIGECFGAEDAGLKGAGVAGYFSTEVKAARDPIGEKRSAEVGKISAESHLVLRVR